MAQRSIRSAVLILGVCVASSLGLQTPKCSRCKHRITGPTVWRLGCEPGLASPHAGISATNDAALVGQ